MCNVHSIKFFASNHVSINLITREVQSKRKFSSACLKARRQHFILSGRNRNKAEMFFPFRSIMSKGFQSPWLKIILSSHQSPGKHFFLQTSGWYKSCNFVTKIILGQTFDSQPRKNDEVFGSCTSVCRRRERRRLARGNTRFKMPSQRCSCGVPSQWRKLQNVLQVREWKKM